jgi:hypothetical protein
MMIPVDTNTYVYTFIARVHPERYGYSIFDLPTWNFTSDNGARVSTFRFQLNDSQMTIRAEVNYEVPVLDLKNEISTMAGAALDSLGFIFSAALSLEMIGCIDHSGVWHVFNTIFDGFREQGDEAQKRELHTFNTLLPHALTSSVHLALSDLRRAISEPHDTVFHCYRAIETIRQEYIPDADDRRDRVESWNRLRTAIGMSRDELDWLKDLAEPRRHGKLVIQSHETRIRAIRIAREVVYKHCVARSLDPHVKVEFGPRM